MKPAEQAGSDRMITPNIRVGTGCLVVLSFFFGLAIGAIAVGVSALETIARARQPFLPGTQVMRSLELGRVTLEDISFGGTRRTICHVIDAPPEVRSAILHSLIPDDPRDWRDEFLVDPTHILHMSGSNRWDILVKASNGSLTWQAKWGDEVSRVYRSNNIVDFNKAMYVACNEQLK